jgi:signal peptidase II
MHNYSAGDRRFAVWMAVAVLVVIVDQLTKLAIIQYIELYGRVPLTSFINLTHQRNPGAAFSFLADGGGWQRWFFTILASIVSVVIATWLFRSREDAPLPLSAGLALILGGAVGNLIDRVVHGYVTDFIQVWFGDWAFPSFNVADSAITVGATFLIVDSLFFSGRKAGKESPPA